jgi:DNA-binding transcriptional LysR family regulator
VLEAGEIEAFLAVADELHFGRAANRMKLTTSRVSQLVRALERRVGAPLFERSSRRVSLTAVGEQFLADVRPAHRQLGRALDRARRAARQRTELLRIGFVNSLTDTVPRALVAAFSDTNPGRTLAPSRFPLLEFTQLLARGQIDMAVPWLPATPDRLDLPGLRFGPVFMRHQRALLVSKTHSLAGRREVDAEELADHAIVVLPAPSEAFADAWTPPVTPGGRPIPRVRRFTSIYLEEVYGILRSADVAHLSLIGPHIRHNNRDDLTVVPVTGLEPVVLTSAWSESREDPMIHAVARLASRLGRQRAWDQVPLPGKVQDPRSPPEPSRPLRISRCRGDWQ